MCVGTMRQLFPSGLPFPSRYGHSSVADDRTGLIYTMGGTMKTSLLVYDDIWQLDVISSELLHFHKICH